MEDWDSLSVQWLCRRAQLLSRNGLSHRGLVYQLVAYHMQPADMDVLYGLAELFALTGDGDRALTVIEKMEEMGENAEELSLLRINAHMATGGMEEAAGLLAQQAERPEAES